MVLKYFAQNITLKLQVEKCILCQECIEVCPHDVFKIMHEKLTIHALERCIECGACAKNCPTEALSVRSGVGCAQAYFNSYFNGGKVSCDCSPNDHQKKGCC